MQFEYTALGLLALIAVETSVLVWKSPRKYSAKKFEKPIFVDTSVLMDGRIVGIAQTGFITSELIVPRSVILELQLLADKSNHDKRERARFGLDVVAELQAMEGLKVTMFDDGIAKEGVDERLLELARNYHGSVMTIDFNLNKVASVENIIVLNINELAQGLRMAHLPGEKFSIELIEKGSDGHQAVGYLADGTMVVIENASSKLGQVCTVECIRSLQTVAGKMLFARLVLGVTETRTHDSKPAGRRKATVAKTELVKQQATKQTIKKEEGENMNQNASQDKNHNTHTNDKRGSVHAKPGDTRQKSNISNSNSNKPTGNGLAQAPSRQQSSRPKTSKQREESLLRTIENQQD